MDRQNNQVREFQPLLQPELRPENLKIRDNRPYLLLPKGWIGNFGLRNSQSKKIPNPTLK